MMPNRLRPIFLLRWLSLAILLLVSGAAAQAQVAFKNTASYVDDLAHVLSPEDVQRLGDLARGLDRETGYQMLFVTVPSLEGEDIAQAATRYGNIKRAGRAGKDTGIVLMRAVAEKKTFIATGKGTEGIVTDLFAGEVFRDTMRPLMREGRVGDAFYEGGVRLRDRIVAGEGDAAEPNPIPDGPPPDWREPGAWLEPRSPGGAAPVVILAFFVMIAIMIIQAVVKANRCPRCRTPMQVTEKVVRPARMFRNGYGYRTRRCPNCGYKDKRRFTIPRQGPWISGGSTGGGSSWGGGRSSGGGGWSSGGWSSGGGGGWSGGGGFSGGGGSFGGGGAGGSD